MVNSPFAWPEVTSVAVIAVPVLLAALLVVALGTRNRLVATHREHLEELTRLREELSRLPAPEALPRIGAENPVFQVGEQVAVVDGPHTGDQGTVVATPEWVRQGFVCVELVRERGRRYMPVAKLSRLGEPVG